MSFIDKVDARELNNIDSLRGSLALMVVLHHYMFNYFLWKDGYWDINGYNLFRFLGPLAVYVFFIISGYLFSSIEKKSFPKWIEFYKKRIFRIIPVCLISSIICIFISYVLGNKKDLSVLNISYWLDGGLLNKRPELFGFSDSNLINAGVTWTLHWEWLLYISLPFISLILKKERRLIASVAVSTLCIIAYCVIKKYVHDTDLSNTFKYIFCFSCGYTCRFMKSERLVRYLTSKITILITILISIIIIISGNTYGIPTAMVAFIIFYNVINGRSIFGLLKVQGLRRIGVVSYSIYLMHGICWFIGFHLITKDSNIITMSSLTFLTIIILSIITSLLIEYPSYNWTKNTSKNKTTQLK
ncbi:acyltransferase [Tatumella sp. JGM118]|nr:acyltransferase [Tatumella sp. JGM118]